MTTCHLAAASPTENWPQYRGDCGNPQSTEAQDYGRNTIGYKDPGKYIPICMILSYDIPGVPCFGVLILLPLLKVCAFYGFAPPIIVPYIPSFKEFRP